jgi:hypothetical protein
MLVAGETLRLAEGRFARQVLVCMVLLSWYGAVERSGARYRRGTFPREADHHASAALDSCDATDQVASARPRPAAEPRETRELDWLYEDCPHHEWCCPAGRVSKIGWC